MEPHKKEGSAMTNVSLSFLFAGLFVSGCFSFCANGQATLRVASYNVRYQTGDVGTANEWDERKADLADFIRKLDLDVFGLQEVCPGQADYLTNCLPQYAMVGVHREDGKREGEASPVFYRKVRFGAVRSGTFWLSETPDVPGSKSWETVCTRVCSWVLLKDRNTGKTFCFANTHTDHVSELARKEGMLLIIRKMREFAPSGTPIVFTGDHNCREIEEPAQAVSKLLKNALYVSETPPKGPWRTFNGWIWSDAEYSTGDALKLPVAKRNALLGGKDIPYAERYACGGARIDYIYVSEGVCVKSYETHSDARPGTKLYPSDHFPVTATIEIVGTPGKTRLEQKPLEDEGWVWTDGRDLPLEGRAYASPDEAETAYDRLPKDRKAVIPDAVWGVE